MADNKYGRTLFDWISEHPKKAFFIGIAIFSLTIFLVTSKIPFKVGAVEVGTNLGNERHSDTIVKIKVDTFYLASPNTHPREKSNSKIQAKQTLIRKGNDTIISVIGQPANINTSVNNGIIGNNNRVEVVNEKQLEFTNEDKAVLTRMLKDLQSQLPNENKDCIKLTTTWGNERSARMGIKVLDFLKTKNIILSPANIAVGVFTDVRHGFAVYIKDGCIHIDVLYV